ECQPTGLIIESSTDVSRSLKRKDVKLGMEWPPAKGYTCTTQTITVRILNIHIGRHKSILAIYFIVQRVANNYQIRRIIDRHNCNADGRRLLAKGIAVACRPSEGI